MSKYVKSPIYYAGNKYKLLKQIKQYFPTEIDTFYDVFGGSGTVALNMLKSSKKVVYNEFDKYVYNLFNFYKENHPEYIHKMIMKEINKYKLEYSSFDINNGEIYKKHKKQFAKMENEYFEKKYNKPIHHILLMIYSFQHKLTFNNNGFTKNGAGITFYNKDIMLRKMYAIYNKPIKTINGSFEDLMDIEFNENDFLYFDPPYWNTNANYNDGWTWELETKLLNWLDELTAKGIKWAFSNVFEHKGKINHHLKEWAEKGSYKVFYPDIQYTMGIERRSEKTVEVFITNYDPVGIGDYTEQLSLDLFGGNNESS